MFESISNPYPELKHRVIENSGEIEFRNGAWYSTPTPDFKGNWDGEIERGDSTWGDDVRTSAEYF